MLMNYTEELKSRNLKCSKLMSIRYESMPTQIYLPSWNYIHNSSFSYFRVHLPQRSWKARYTLITSHQLVCNWKSQHLLAAFSGTVCFYEIVSRSQTTHSSSFILITLEIVDSRRGRPSSLSIISRLELDIVLSLICFPSFSWPFL